MNELDDIWYASVGRGCNLLLNVPADRRGLIPEPDIARLRQLRALLDATFAVDLAKHRPVVASNLRGADPSFAAGNVTDGDPATYWCADDNTIVADLEIALGAQQPVNRVDVRETIALGQRIERFQIDALISGTWRQVAEGTTIGPRRVLRFPTVSASSLRVKILAAKACPALSSVSCYCAPPEVAITASDVAFTDTTTVTMQTDMPDATIHYTLDGTGPTSASPSYTAPFVLRDSTRIRAVAIRDGRASLYPAAAQVILFDEASFRPGIQLFAPPRPGLRMRRFDGAVTSLEGLDKRTVAAEEIVDQIALPKARPADHFALVFNGYLTIAQDGIYTFTLRSDDSSRLYIGNELVCDADARSAWESREGRIPLRAGTHLFRVEYFEAKGQELLRVRWSGPGFDDVTIPANVLGH